MPLPFSRYYNSRFDNAENIGLKFELVNKDGQTYLSTNKDKAEVCYYAFLIVRGLGES